MTEARAIQGVFSDLKTVKTRSVIQLIIECPIEQAESIIKMLGFPQPSREIPVAVARLTAPIETKPDKENGHKRHFDELPLPQQAALACNDPRFQAFLKSQDPLRWNLYHSLFEEDQASAKSNAAAEWVRHKLEISSRSELKSNPDAAERWKSLYTAFLAENRI